MTKLYGASDDLICLDGDLTEEFYSYDEEENYIAFSDGTLVKIVYDNDGLWRITVLAKGELFDKKEEGNIEEDINDIVYFKHGIKWCVLGNAMVRR